MCIRDRQNTISELKKIILNGAKEIVLSGINIGDFGKNFDESLFDLLEHIENLNGLQRYRISSIEPNLLTDEIIDLISKSRKAMPHFHIPLQSGSDKILKYMKRKYLVSDYTLVIDKVKNRIPNACIGVDVIVGFPGESDADFSDTYEFLSQLDISYLHVFTYSERKNTDAANFKKSVDKKTRAHRSLILRRLSEKKTIGFL